MHTTMKKIYQTPALQLTEICCETLIAESLHKYSGDGGTQLVKEDATSTSRDSYNVWDDDWSKN